MFRDLFETAPDAMVVVDRAGRIVLANPQAHRLFGFAPETLIGAPIEDLMPEGARDAHRGHRDRYMNSPRVRPMGAGQQLTGLRATGETFPVEIALSPIETAAGRYFVASIRDVSETQLARQAIARARLDSYVAQIGQLALETPEHASVLESAALLVAGALDVQTVAIVIADPDRRELQIRAATGTTVEALRAPAWSPASDDPIASLIASGKPAVMAETELARWQEVLPGFAPGATSAVLVPLFDLGQPMGALVAFSSERRSFDRDAVHFMQAVANVLAAAAQRSRTEDQLSHAQRLEAIGQLTGGIAHDFNNLLTVVLGNLQLLEDEVADRPQAMEIIGGALRAVGRGAELTRKLLAFARRQKLAPRAIAPQQLVGDVGAILKRTLGELIRVELDCPDNLPPVYADPSQLDAALVNLALNSRDAMPRGGTLTISVAARRIEDGEVEPGDYVVFTVADTGHGMPPEVLARAFEPFFTTKGAGKGSGLGLSMVYGFVRQSGGQLGVESQLGYGTRIELQLPAARQASDAPGRATKPATPGHETVLVVEDEAEVRRIAVAFLRSLGYRVLEASDADGALEQVKGADGIDLLFSDVVLGSGISGIELALEAVRRRPALKVLLTSGYERGALEAGSGAGAEFELLRKPYRREELSTALRRVLAGG